MAEPVAAESREGSKAGPDFIRPLVLLAAVALLAFSVFQEFNLYSFYLAQDRLPLWDMAAHGWEGLQLARDVRSFDLPGFAWHLNRHYTWPFVYSLLLVPYFLVGGMSFAAATMLSTTLFALTPLLLLWAGYEIDGGKGSAGVWAGAAAGILFLASPLLRLLAILIMIEMPAVFFSLLALCLYLRARRIGSLNAYRLAGLAALVLFFTKYNYGLIWLLAVAANEFWSLPADRRRAGLRRAAGVLWPLRRPRVGRIVLAAYLHLLAVLFVLGINIGDSVYAGLVIGAALLALIYWRRREDLLRWWRGLSVRGRAALETFVFPVWVWGLSPNPIHLRGVFGFLMNRPGDLPLLSPQSLLFYFSSFINDYVAEPLLGLALLALALSGLALWRKGSYRILILATGLSVLLMTLHAYKLPRFFATAAPLLMLLAALAFAHWVYDIGARKIIGAALCAVAVLGVLLVFFLSQPYERLRREYTLYSGDPALGDCLGYLEESVAGDGRVAVVGAFNELSIDLVRWALLERPASGGLVFVAPLPRIEPEAPPAEVRQCLDEWVGCEHPDRIVAIKLLPASPYYGSEDYQAHNAWQLAPIAVLKANSGWRQEGYSYFGGLGLEIIIFGSPRAADPEP